jgi:hypothetical protein
MSHRHVPLLLGALAIGLALLFAVGTPSNAEEGDAGHIVYLSITGEGPNARAWYKGAPPAGALVQEALDRFSAEGYHVAEVRPYQRSVVTVLTQDSGIAPRTAEVDESFIILLEK